MNREEKIIHIQKIAFNFFLDQGYEATTIRTICKKAGVEAPSIYNFFDSKRGLFLSVVSSLWEHYIEENTRCFCNKSELCPDKNLYLLFKFSMKYTLEHLDETRFFLRFSLFPPDILKEDIFNFLLQQQTYKLNQIHPIIADCIHQGLFDTSLERATALFIKYVNCNTFDLVFTHGTPSEEELLESWEMFYMQINGCGKAKA